MCNTKTTMQAFPQKIWNKKNNSRIFAESAHLLWQEMEYQDWIADLEQCSRLMSSVRYDSEEAVMFGLAVVPDLTDFTGPFHNVDVSLWI